MSDFSAIKIFRPGPHSRELTAAALREAAAGYDPTTHEAPITIGHPANDAPAHGWIGALQFDESDSSLKAIPRLVSDGLKSVVNQGLFKHVSAAFYPPHSASNPTPGKWALRHVGFLGAQPPKVKGLGAVSFAEGETADDFLTVEFAESGTPKPYIFSSIGSVLRGLRDWIISKDGVEAANKALPDYAIDSLQREAGRLEEAAGDTRRFSEPETIPTDPKEDEPVDPKDTDTFAEREAKLEQRAAELTAQEQALAARAAEADHAEATTFAEGLAGTGRILPRHAPTVAGLLGALPAEATVAFSEGDETPVQVQKPGREAFRAFLESLPEQVDFSEVSAPTGEDLPGNVTAIRVPEGHTVSDANADLDKRAQEYAEKNNTDYATALAAVAR